MRTHLLTSTLKGKFLLIPDEWDDWMKDELRSLLDKGWSQEEVDNPLNELDYNKREKKNYLQDQLSYLW